MRSVTFIVTPPAMRHSDCTEFNVQAFSIFWHIPSGMRRFDADGLEMIDLVRALIAYAGGAAPVFPSSLNERGPHLIPADTP